MSSQSQRNNSLDLIRVISMFFVICIHTSPWPMSAYPSVTSLLTVIFFVSNSCFYMLSGQLNLSKKFDDEKSIKLYYKKKAIGILYPLVLMTIIICIFMNILTGSYTTLWEFVKYVYGSFMYSNIKTHLWYMYALIGMLLAAPFFSKMLRAMSDKEVQILFVVGMIWKIMSIYLCLNLDVKFSFQGWFLDSWVFTFFAGYYCNRMINEKNEKILYILGIIGFIISFVGLWKLKDYSHNTYDLAPAYILFAMSVYAFVSRHIHIKLGVFQKVLSFIAKYSFIIYIVHWYVYKYLTIFVVDLHPNTLNFVVSVFFTFVCSLIISIIIDTILIRPVQKFFLAKIR